MEEKPKKQHTMWTKEMIRKLFDLWESKTTRQIAEELGLSVVTVQLMISSLRANGAKIVKKKKWSQRNFMVKEFLKENPQYVTR